MPLESTTTISGLTVTNPAASDNLQQADDHMRLIKNVLKTTFPAYTGVQASSHTQVDAAIASLAAGITTAQIGALQVTTAKIADLNVTEAKIAAGAVTSTKLGAGAVGTAALANDSVTALKIATGEVGNTELASNAVTTLKIADLQVTAAKIADETITAGKIANGTIIDEKIAAETITPGKIAKGLSFGNFTVSGGVVSMGDSKNISGVVRSSAGLFVVSFDTALANAGYTVICQSQDSTTTPVSGMKTGYDTRAVGSFRIQTRNDAGTLTDPGIVSFTVLSND
jgi:hypothetical protein